MAWKWFGYARSDVQQSTVTFKCEKTVTTKGSNTTNVFYHLNHKQPVEYEETSTAVVSSKPKVFFHYFVILNIAEILSYYFRAIMPTPNWHVMVKCGAPLAIAPDAS